MVKLHHPPATEITVNTFKVKVNGESTLPWFCRVSAMPYNTPWPGCQRPIDQTEVASFISFEMDEPVRLELELDRDFEKVTVRPLSKGIKAETDGRKISFIIEKAGFYTVEPDNSHEALHIFANPVSDFGVDKSAENVIYYAPGVYDVGNIELSDGQTLYVDGGAVLYGSVNVINKNNVRIVGYGVIDGSREVREDDTCLLPYSFEEDLRDEETLRRRIKELKALNGCVHLYSCNNCEISGIIARDSSTFAFILANCERTECTWLKTIGMWRYNSDGIDLFNSRYIRIANCFVRDFDDCIVIKGIMGWDKANQHHILVEGCTVWCDWGRGLELGAETCADEYHDILWHDCDLIHGCHIHIDLQNSDRAWIHDMLVKDIRCEYEANYPVPMIQDDMTVPYRPDRYDFVPWVIASPIYYGPFSENHPLGRTTDVRFEDIHIFAEEGVTVPHLSFDGENEYNANSGIIIENVTFNGKRLKPEEVIIEASEFDTDITVR